MYNQEAFDKAYKKYREKGYEREKPSEPRHWYENEIKTIQKVLLFNYQIGITELQAYNIWDEYSSCFAASWLRVEEERCPSCLNSFMFDYGEEEETTNE